MKKLVIFVSTVLFLGVSASSAQACDCAKRSTAASGRSSCQGGCGQSSGIPTSCTEGLLEARNAACPVSGQPIGSMGEGVTYTHEGKAYRLCCAGCIEKFKADPDKYIKVLEGEEG